MPVFQFTKLSCTLNLVVDFFLYALQFSKSSGMYIEENKLRVVLTIPAPDAIPVNGNSVNGSLDKTPKYDRHSTNGLNNPISELV